MDNKTEKWHSQDEIIQFIHLATRWKINAVFKSRTDKKPYSIFTYYVFHARRNFDLFATQLNTKLTKNKNWKAIQIDLKDRFIEAIDRYIDWYDQNKKEIEKFQPSCPYSDMLNVMESTKAQILKYFPDLKDNLQQPLTVLKEKPKLTIKQIALIYVYKDAYVNRENASEIVKKYGHNSGDKLYNEFIHFSSKANRKGSPTNYSKITLKNKIKLFESVIKHLPIIKQKSAKDEVSHLKKMYKDQYKEIL